MQFFDTIAASPVFTVLFGTSGVLLVAATVWSIIAIRRSRRRASNEPDGFIAAEGSKDVSIEGNKLPSGSRIVVRHGQRVVIRNNSLGTHDDQ